jgi:hypothetical protein
MSTGGHASPNDLRVRRVPGFTPYRAWRIGRLFGEGVDNRPKPSMPSVRKTAANLVSTNHSRFAAENADSLPRNRQRLTKRRGNEPDEAKNASESTANRDLLLRRHCPYLLSSSRVIHHAASVAMKKATIILPMTRTPTVRVNANMSVEHLFTAFLALPTAFQATRRDLLRFRSTRPQ